MTATYNQQLHEHFVAVARTYLGTKFKHQGRLRGIAIDCVGLLVCVGRECGLEIEDHLDYDSKPNAAILRAAIERCCDEVTKRDHRTGAVLPAIARPGEIILFRLDSEKPETAVHAAMRTPCGILHARGEVDVARVVEHGLTEGWRSRADSVWRYRSPAVA